MPLTANRLFKLHVTNDALTATLMLNANTLPTPQSPDEIAAEIAALGIILDDDSYKAIAQFAKTLEKNEIPEPTVIARGKTPVHEKNGKAEKLYEKKQQQDSSDSENDSEKVDQDQSEAKDSGESQNTDQQQSPDDVKPNGQSHYDRSDIISVKKDAPIMRLHEPTPGKDGQDVYGKNIPRKLGIEAKVKLGPNVRQEGKIIFADSDGSVNYKNNRIWVDTALEIPGDVDFSVGNIDFCGDVNIAKNIIDLFKVRSDANITVRGLIEAAEVYAKLDLHCTGGIAGKEKGVFSAGNDIISKYITNAAVRAGNDVKVNTEIVNCHLVCRGKVIVENGPLVGGHTIATGGLRVKQLGSEAGVKMLVEVGIDEQFREKCFRYAPEIDQRRAKARKVRQVVEPLLANQKHLNKEQKEKATELLYQTYELEEEVDKMLNELREAMENPAEETQLEIEVLATAFPGPTLRFPQVEATITEALKGPITFVPQKIKGILQVVAIESNTGSAHPLRSGGNRDKLWEVLDRLLNPPEDQE